MIRLYSNTIIIDAIRHVHYLCFSLCLVEGTHREHVRLVEVDAQDVAHVDCTLSMLNMSNIVQEQIIIGGQIRKIVQHILQKRFDLTRW